MKPMLILAFALAEEIMQGEYTDPNHPGCERVFKVVNSTHGDMFGNDDCKSSTEPWGPLSVSITDTYTLICDFSPKGGPADLQGVYTAASPYGHITWEDGNVWSQIGRKLKQPNYNDLFLSSVWRQIDNNPHFI